MIPRLNRLPSTRLVSSQTISLDSFTIRYAGNTLSYNRFAFVVGKRIDKRAVIRNRLKRVLRELIFRHSLSFSGIDMIIIVKKNFIEESTAEIEKEVNSALSSIHI